MASPGATAYSLRALALSVGLFGVLRLAWVEANLLAPFTAFQGKLAVWGGSGVPSLVQVGLNCSGADALALCLAFVALWPSRLDLKLAGLVGGVLVVVSVNVARIASLVRMEGSAWFPALHEYVWPALLTLTSAAYVFVWMTRVARDSAVQPGPPLGHAKAWRAFGVLAAAVAVFYAATPWYLHSPPLVALAEWMASTAATVLTWLGATARASGPVLETASGAYLVTGECIATPVIPVGLAAIMTLSPTWRARLLWLLAAGPIVVVLGLARLLVLALPSSLTATPDFWAHAFFQLMLAVAGVWVLASVGGRPLRGSVSRAALATAAGVGAAAVLGLAYSESVAAAGLAVARPLVDDPAGLAQSLPDSQGALALLPPFQAGLLLALALASARVWTLPRLFAGLLLLVGSQVLFFGSLYAVAALSGLQPPVAGIRAVALLVPAGLLLLLARPAAALAPPDYVRFWEEVGAEFPDLGGARSTDYYRANEIRLLDEHLPRLQGARVLKTDLWDEARNTRILAWAAGQGASCFGIDISTPTIRLARQAFTSRPLYAAAADVRQLPFPTDAFDAIYSMGTIEHFDDDEKAVAEIYRVLAPGGRAIVGVPNRHDPFLRPLMVWALQRVGLYAYGAERSYSRDELRRLLERAGFQVEVNTGILFIPGWLRMADLACHAWCRPLTMITSPMVAVFRALDSRFPALRQHGYLLAAVAIKPSAITAAPGR
jgi:exosortase/archaeosortase family protein